MGYFSAWVFCACKGLLFWCALFEGIKDFFLNKTLVITKGIDIMDSYEEALVEEVNRLRALVTKLKAEVLAYGAENRSLYSLLSSKREDEKERSEEKSSPIKKLVEDKIDSVLLNREIELLLKVKPDTLA